MTKRQVVIHSGNCKLKITTNKPTLFSRIIITLLFVLSILSILLWIYLSINKKWDYFEYLFFSIICIFLLILSQRMIHNSSFTIESISNQFLINGKYLHSNMDSKCLVVYEYAGETIINSIGNLSIKMGGREYKIFNSASEQTINEIKSALNEFFAISLNVEKKILY